MTSRTSLFNKVTGSTKPGTFGRIFTPNSLNKSLIKSDIKRFWWVSALYFLCLFFILPLNHYMKIQSIPGSMNKEKLIRTFDLATTQLDFQKYLICVIPTVLAVLIFSYLHNSRSTAMIHSLPFSRRTLFFSHSFSGLVLVILPVIFTGLLLITLNILTPLGECYSIYDIFLWAGYILIFDVLFFCFAVFVGMFTGNSIAHIILTYMLHYLPVAIYDLIRYNTSQLLYGYSGFRVTHGESFDPYPISMVITKRFSWRYSDAKHLLWYTILIMLIFTCTMYVYRKRKLESAGDIITFSGLKPIFKYGATICFTLIGGACLSYISGGSFAAVSLGYIVSSFFGYWIAEMLIHKSIKVWHAYKGHLAFSILVLVVLAGIKTDVTGYVKYIPSPHEVREVYLGTDLGIWIDPAFREYYSKPPSAAENFNSFFLKEEENIKNTIQLHNHLIQSPIPYRNKIASLERNIIYTLKNGKQIMRKYYIDGSQFSDYLRPIYESTEYKEERYSILTQKPDEIKFIELKDDRSAKKPVILSDDREINEFVELLKRELYKTTYEDLTQERVVTPIKYIDIGHIDGKLYRYALRNQYSSVLNWLKKKDYYEKIMLLPGEIEYAVLEKQSYIDSSKLVGGGKLPEKTVLVKEPQIIDELLNLCNYNQYAYDKEIITVEFYVKGNPGYHRFKDFIYKDAAVSDEFKKIISSLYN